MTKLISFFACWLAAAFAPMSTINPDMIQNQNAVPKIQVALLLDSSGSMQGLIEQAKSQLWKMVNELATSKRDGKIPEIEIALYEYGKDDYPASTGHIKQLLALTTDLDQVSEKLFEIRTNGGNEYCGWVIEDATDKLKWSKRNNDLKIIFIAGNEPFTQGSKDYKETCKAAISKGIVVNTIFCGNCEEGVRTMWKDGADRADGKYMCINHNETVVHIATPFDDEIVKLNSRLNSTYIAYGSKGSAKKERQMAQDANAGVYSQSNVAERAISKASAAYKNEDWDAVDAFKDNEKALENLKNEDLPEEMKGMNAKERKDFIDKKAKERTEIQNKIREASEKRDKYITEERKKSSSGKKNTLDEVMLNTVREQAQKKNYKFD